MRCRTSGSNLDRPAVQCLLAKTIDLEIASGNNQGKKQLGIYTVKDDTLTLCFAFPGETDRPTKLESNDESKTILIVLKREKK